MRKIKDSFSRFVFLSIPIIPLIIATVGLVVCITITKLNCHTQRWFIPFFSKNGLVKPESTIFTFVMSLTGSFGVATVCISWAYRQFLSPLVGAINNCILFSGILSFFGYLWIGSCTTIDDALAHEIGVYFAGGFGFIYALLMTIVAWRRVKGHYPSTEFENSHLKRSVIIKTTLLVIATVFVCVFTATTMEGRKFIEYYGITKIKKHEQVFEWVLKDGTCKNVLKDIPIEVKILESIGAITQYISIISHLVFVSFNIKDFKNLLTAAERSQGFNPIVNEARSVDNSVIENQMTK